MKNFLLILSFFVGFTLNVNSQCTVDTYGQYGAPNPACGSGVFGAWAATTWAYSREYSIVNVTAGNTYEFQSYVTSGGATRFTTITTTANVVLASGSTNTATSVTWVATFTGQVRFWTHLNASCGASTVNQTRRVRCLASPCSTPSNSGTLSVNKTQTVDNDEITWLVSGGDPIIRYEYRFNGGTWTNFNSNNNPLSLVIHSNGGNIEMRAVHQNNSCPISYSNISITNFDCAPYLQFGPSDGDYITNVTLNTINNNSTSDFLSGLSPINTDAYQNFTSISTDLFKGDTYLLSVSGTFTFGSNQGFATWIDWNGDGIFEMSENVLISAPVGTATAQVTVPLNAVSGSVKMRVLCRWNATPSNDACAPVNYLYGEIEEYSINILDVNPLPVTLTSFTSSCDNGIPVLSWTTESEQNSDYFQIEKSWDGFEWKSVSQVQAAGNSNQIINYQFYDVSSGRFEGYYRLKQVDFDGQFEYFGPIHTDCIESKSDFYSELFPNPTTGEIFIGIRNNQQEVVEILITDNSGRVLNRKNFDIINGYTMNTFDLSIYNTGIYQIHIYTKNRSYIHKVFKN